MCLGKKPRENNRQNLEFCGNQTTPKNITRARIFLKCTWKFSIYSQQAACSDKISYKKLQKNSGISLMSRHTNYTQRTELLKRIAAYPLPQISCSMKPTNQLKRQNNAYHQLQKFRDAYEQKICS